MKRTIRISEDSFECLRTILLKDSPSENAAFLLVGLNKLLNQEIYLVRRIVEIPEEMFIIKNEIHIEISSQAINGILSLCEANHLGLVLCHSHPFSDRKLDYSPSDDFGEIRINNLFHKLLPNSVLLSLLFGKNNIIGRYWSKTDSSSPISRIEIIGNSIRKIELNNPLSKLDIDDSRYSRQISAFGEEGQRKIIETKVGIVGTGGTGSIISEQLVRLGVMDIKIADYDRFSKTNISRMYGSYNSDIPTENAIKIFNKKKYKVDIIESHLKRINPSLNIRTYKQSIVYNNVAQNFLDRDIIFSCTDDHWGRAILNQMSYQYIIPVINTGVRLSSLDGKFLGGNIVSHLLKPDKPCLWCYEYIKSDIIQAESMKAENRKDLVREGYIENIDLPQPSVITYTSLGSCLSIEIFLNLVTGYLGEYGNISSLRSDMLNLDIRRGTVMIKKNCICKNVYARGNTYPLYTI